METTYEFTAYNTEVIYGYGSEIEARLYLDWLNRDREMNQYEMALSSLSDEQADILAVNLQENLADLADLADLELLQSRDN